MTDKLLRAKEVMKIVGLGKTSLYGYMKAGMFPKGVKIGPRAVAWPESAVNRWVADRLEGKPLSGQAE